MIYSTPSSMVRATANQGRKNYFLLCVLISLKDKEALPKTTAKPRAEYYISPVKITI
jgi:hypothetical protein